MRSWSIRGFCAALVVASLAAGAGEAKAEGVVSPKSGAGKYPRVIHGLQVSGDLERELVYRHLLRVEKRFSFCYERQLLNEPGLAGDVKARFLISASGATIGITAEGVSNEVSACVGHVLRRVEFPKGEDRKPVRVLLVLRFPRA